MTLNARNQSTVSEYIQHLSENKIIDFNNPSCCDCNNCCDITTIITNDEYTFYKKYFKNNKEGKLIYKEAVKSFKKTFKNGNTINLLCPFLNNKKRCRIYKIRPLMCKSFHCSENLRNDEVIDKLKDMEKNISRKTIYSLFE